MGERHNCIQQFSSRKSRITAHERPTEPAFMYCFPTQMENIQNKKINKFNKKENIYSKMLIIIYIKVWKLDIYGSN